MRAFARLAIGLAVVASMACARHHVVPREQGRVDGARSIASSSDLEWTVRSAPSASAEAAEP